MDKIQGIILKGVGGSYTVLTDSGERLVCRARGAFRHAKISPLAGDRVVVTPLDDGSNAISAIGDRTGALIRPPLANLGVLFIAIATSTPDPYLPLSDKLTVICAREKIRPVVVITKALLKPDTAEEIAAIYRGAGIETFITDSPSGIGIEELRAFFLSKEGAADQISAFCGVSGAGKSTLINALFPTLSLEVGALSQRIERGKNTTRHSEIFPLSELFPGSGCTGFLADTPGFSMLDFTRFFFCTLSELPELFVEFEPLLGRCRYTSCTHTVDEGCAILEAIKNGEISKSRHDSFLVIRDELLAKGEDYSSKQ